MDRFTGDKGKSADLPVCWRETERWQGGNLLDSGYILTLILRSTLLKESEFDWISV